MSLVSQLQEYLYLFILGVPRVAMAMLFIPTLSPQALGGSLVRNAILICFALFLFPIVSTQLADVNLDRISMLMILSQEIVIGLIYGFFIGLPFYLINALGGIIDIQRGSQMGQLFNPGLGGQGTEMTTFFNVTFSILFFTVGPFLVTIGVILRSYTQIPIAISMREISIDLINNIATGFQSALTAAVTYAGPIIMTIFFVDLSLGLINRFSPAVNVFILSLPIKSWTGIVMSMILFTIIMDNMLDFTRFNLGELEYFWHYFPKSANPTP